MEFVLSGVCHSFIQSFIQLFSKLIRRVRPCWVLAKVLGFSIESITQNARPWRYTEGTVPGTHTDVRWLMFMCTLRRGGEGRASLIR